MADGIIPSPDAWRRIGEAVRKIEAPAAGPVGRGALGGAADRGFWAELLAVDAGDWTWREKVPKADGTWEDMPGGRTSVRFGTARETYDWTAGVGQIVRMVPLATPSGDLVWRFESPTPGPFPVLVTKDDGGAGSESTDCTWTYTVKDLFGTQLGTGLTPERARYSHVAYVEAPNDSYGLACWNDEGALVLLVCFGEIETTDVCP